MCHVYLLVFWGSPCIFSGAEEVNKALYGLKQAANCWHETIVRFMISEGLVQYIMDTCVFVRRLRSSTLIILIWVDDLIIGASDQTTLVNFKQNFSKTFAIKEL